MSQELDLNGHRYSIGKLSAKQQFHVSRRIAPIVPTLIPVFVRLAAGGRGHRKASQGSRLASQSPVQTKSTPSWV